MRSVCSICFLCW